MLECSIRFLDAVVIEQPYQEEHQHPENHSV